MPRRESTIDALLESPWWASVALAIFTYTALAHVLPKIELQSALFKSFSLGLAPMAEVFAGLLLIIATLSFVRTLVQRHRRVQQRELNTVRALPWEQFEDLVGECFRRRGYRVVSAAQGGPDGGVDVTLEKDGTRAFVQCKHWRKSKVGVKTLRELYGVVVAKGADEGFVVCSGSFTADAKVFARESGIQLVDGQALIKMVLACRGEALGQHKAAPDDTLCPVCQSEMVRRTARRGRHAGSEFMGCSTYPSCRGTRSV